MKQDSDNKLQNRCKELLESPVEKSNHAPFLLAALETVQCEELHKLMTETLGHFFMGAIERGELVLTGQGKIEQLPDSPEKQYLTWILKLYAKFKQTLVGVLGGDHSFSIQVCCLSVLMDLLGGEYIGETSRMGYAKLVETLVIEPTIPPEVLSTWMSKYFNYADIRYLTLVTIEKIAASLTHEPGKYPPNTTFLLYNILKNIPVSFERCKRDNGVVQSWCGGSEVGASVPAVPAAYNNRRRRIKRHLEIGIMSNLPDKKNVVWLCEKAHCTVFSSAWLAFLRLEIPDALLHQVLMHIPEGVIPHMQDPQMLCDFLTVALDSGGILGILALDGIFMLVTKYGIEYPSFYKRLYGLLNSDIFHMKQREKFLRLVDKFLVSGLVPAYTAAAFIKKLARISLIAPPHGAMVCISFIHNLLRRHPSCNVLVHCPKKVKTSSSDGQNLLVNDPYDAQAEDPADSYATGSSLWEMDILRNHMCPQVAKYVTMLDKDLTKKRATTDVDISLALAASYTSLFDECSRKRMKTVPLEIHEVPPAQLFGPSWLEFGSPQDSET